MADELNRDLKIAWLVDYEGYTFKNTLPMRTIADLIHILQNHYPERLGQIVCYKPPKIFSVSPQPGPAARLQRDQLTVGAVSFICAAAVLEGGATLPGPGHGPQGGHGR